VEEGITPCNDTRDQLETSGSFNLRCLRSLMHMELGLSHVLLGMQDSAAQKVSFSSAAGYLFERCSGHTISCC
jgi:hypothetical protein